MIDVRQEPMILEFPSFDSKYVSLMVTAYDHYYVNIPMSTTQGDFDKPSRVLFYSQRTQGYRGDPVPDVDRVTELTGEFVSAVVHVMPHANEPVRLQHNLTAMRETRLLTLSDYLAQNAAEVEFVPWQTPAGYRERPGRPAARGRVSAVWPHRFRCLRGQPALEVMQFVFYNVHLLPGLTLTADFQYIDTGLGGGPLVTEKPDDAWVGGLRLRLVL